MQNKFVRKKKYNNPFVKAIPRQSWWQQKKNRFRLRLAGSVIIISGLVYVFVYSGFLEVRQIVVSGTNNQEVITEIQLITRQYININWWGFIPQDNLLVLNKKKLAEKINQGLVLEKLDIKPSFRHKLKIEAKEKIPVLLWQNYEQIQGGLAEEYYYIDRLGIVMGSILFNQVEYDLPLAAYATSSRVIVGRQVIKPDQVEFIVDFFNQSGDKFDQWQFSKAVIINKIDVEFNFYTNEGWYVILGLGQDIGPRLENLKALLDQKIEDRNQLKYVDLRIKDKIFYQ